MRQSESNQLINSHDCPKIGRRFFLAGLLIVSSGCQNMIRRGQTPDIPEAFAKYQNKDVQGPRYINEVCGISGLLSKEIHGIGLVVGLKGTGSAAKDTGQRKFLQESMSKSNRIDDVDELLASEETEIVILQGQLPAAAKAGDRIDLKVVTMNDSDATSIADGNLMEAELLPMARLGRGVKRGHAAASARGMVLTDDLFTARQGGNTKLEGVILGGGKVIKDRPLGLIIQPEKFNQKTSMQISQAINARFLQSSRSGQDGVAEPKTDRLIELQVPLNYRRNVGHYVSVINQVSFAEPKSHTLKRMETLEQQIGDPAQAALAALRLEAIGRDAVPILRRGLTHQDLEVRFRAAESLAYLEDTSGLDVLQEAVHNEPAFRWQALTALSAINDTSATEMLTRMLDGDGAETRYGAFCALRDSINPPGMTEGEWMGSSFFLCVVSSESEPMVHISRKDRPEIVVFGEQAAFEPGYVHVQPGLTVTIGNNGTAAIKTFSRQFGQESRVCSANVSDVIRNSASLGMGYRQQVLLLQDASESNAINARIAVDARPRLGREQVADSARNGGDGETGSSRADASEPTGFDKIKSWFKRTDS